MQYLPIPFTALDKSADKPAKAHGTKASLTAIGNGIIPPMGQGFCGQKGQG
jgi:hypothetical protein